ncbi:MAG: HNH endonuclease family protein [Rhodospirillaceae bacterium]
MTYALFLLRVGTTERIQRFGRILTALEGSADIHSPDSVLQLTPAECASVATTLDGPVYLGVKTRLPLLLRLDELLSAGGVTHHPDVITVEHVMPQNPAPGSGWVSTFPAPDVRDSWVHRLGNLALLPRRKNSQAGNLDFIPKKTQYFVRNGTTTFALTTQIVNSTVWDEKTLHKRQADLLAVMKKEWRL